MEVYLPVRERRTDIQEIGFLAQNQFQFRATLEGIDQHLSLGVPGHDKLKIVAELLWKAAAKRMVGWDGLGKVELGMGVKFCLIQCFEKWFMHEFFFQIS